MKNFTPLLISALVILGCDSNKIYDSYSDLPDAIWHEDSLVVFDLNLSQSELDYQLTYNVRYIEEYPYYNVYVKFYLEDSASNLIRSELQELILFDKKTGKPLGDGLGDIFDREIPIFNDFKFPYNGDYSFKVKQFMRVENLPGIMSFGIKLKKPAEN